MSVGDDDDDDDDDYDDTGVFDVDHTKPATASTQAADRTTRSRSTERDKLPTSTPDSSRTSARDTRTTTDSSGRLKSGVGTKGLCHMDNIALRTGRWMFATILTAALLEFWCNIPILLYLAILWSVTRHSRPTEQSFPSD